MDETFLHYGCETVLQTVGMAQCDETNEILMMDKLRMK